MSEMQSTRRGRPGYDQQGILAVAVAAFNEHGYDATSIGMLAERLGLSKSAIYHHFGSKDQILDLALDAALSGLEAVVDDPLPASAVEASAVARLEHVLRGAVHVLIAQLPAVTLLLRVRGNTEVERRALTRRRAFDRRITALVSEAQAEGALRADMDASVVARLTFGMINSIVEWYRPGGREGADRLADDVVAIALDGLRRR
ncbi:MULTISPECIES: TetR/AcrR family transcriptional regulator [Microbacterium]|uniref:TetR/AcrR family transcriptional regulator n=1 Tax=Microbacterium aurugineum TaxID=2851642 RepID=A0ABY4J046_9MICO|nr:MULTISPECIES: TetR/AcrR family transcriptional regulator [Microbacterium]MCZ4300271.1 TetR/AcrR family transcriptional regulator [Microbacterium oxydans]QEA30558.1 TetR/AcrR family transcriptional regulator [Microbacterium sp. CBA3102]TCJ20641.1 TetR/AcrR family transcriptional regulator [Microbacterium sp. PI-1]TFB17399.1 TetR/AcrR family transcriptional regulator [Microbacterium sp. 3H14]UPL18379.1 TetR/AcrR family transcriptional regulator [Microbacterium aurugineum]